MGSFFSAALFVKCSMISNMHMIHLIWSMVHVVTPVAMNQAMCHVFLLAFANIAQAVRGCKIPLETDMSLFL